MAATAAVLLMMGGSGRGNDRCGSLSPALSDCAGGGEKVRDDDVADGCGRLT